MEQPVSLFFQELHTCDVSWSKMSHCSFRISIIICIGWTILEAETEEKLVFNLSFAFLSTALVPSLFFLLLTLFVLFLLLVCSRSAEIRSFLVIITQLQMHRIKLISLTHQLNHYSSKNVYTYVNTKNYLLLAFSAPLPPHISHYSSSLTSLSCALVVCTVLCCVARLWKSAGRHCCGVPHRTLCYVCRMSGAVMCTSTSSSMTVWHNTLRQGSRLLMRMASSWLRYCALRMRQILLAHLVHAHMYIERDSGTSSGHGWLVCLFDGWDEVDVYLFRILF